MRVLVTGGAGFIGSHACERLIERGDEVCVLDDLSTGRGENLVQARPGVRLVIGSVTDAELVDELVRCSDLVLHLAAVVGVRLVLEEPVRTVETNVGGTQVVLGAAAKHRVRVLFASSSEVYGRSEALPFREDADLLLGATDEPRWSYACSKAMGEWLALAHARERGLEVVIVRLFNTVGPRQRSSYGMVLPNFVAQALANEPLTVFGDGRQTRSFLHVRDAVGALLGLLEQPEALGRVFNIGGTREVTIGALAELVRERSGCRAPIVHMPHREAYGVHFRDSRRRRPDVTRLRELTGFEPRFSLECIVDELLAAAGRPPELLPGARPALGG